MRSPVQKVDTGVDNEVLRPPPSLAPDKEFSEQLSVLLLHDNSQFNQEESEMMVATRNLGLRLGWEFRSELSKIPRLIRFWAF
jgi:hypothetical protein